MNVEETSNLNLQGDRARRPTERLAMLAIVIATFIAYWPAINAGLIWDDPEHIDKPELQSFDGLVRIWIAAPKALWTGDWAQARATQQYYPLAHSAFWAQYMLWDQHPLGFHVVNVSLHAINAVLVWLVLRKLKLPGAIFAAGLFALHPVNVESVAWITELKNTLSTLFYLLAMLAYLRFDPLAVDNQHARHRWTFFVLAHICFVLALLSKTAVATLPAAILVIIWWKRGRIEFKRDVTPLLPMFIIGASLSRLTVYFEQHIWGSKAENFAGENFNWSFIERSLIAGRAAWFYLSKLLWPTDLAFFYDRWAVDKHISWQYLFPIAIILVLAILLLLRNRIGRGAFAAFLFFGGTILPALGFINLYWQVYTFVCDHMQYLPSIGIFALVAGVASTAVRRQSNAVRTAGIACASLILLALGGLTWKQCHIYKNLETLYRDVMAKSPTCWLAPYNLAVEMRGQGRRAEAIELYKRSIEIRPDYGDAHYNLGNMYSEQREFIEDALRHYDAAIQAYESAFRDKPDLLPIYSTYVKAHFSRGMVLYELGRHDSAFKSFERAAELDPKLTGPLNMMGVIHADRKEWPAAVELYQRALAVDPSVPEIHVNLGMAYLQQQRLGSAIVELREALRLNPALLSRLTMLAEAIAARGMPDEALTILDVVLEAKPDDPRARAFRERITTLPGGTLPR